MKSPEHTSKILVVDDNAHNREYVSALLKEEGFEVITVGDGKSAIAAFITEEPHLIFLDIMMPGMNGYEVCERIRGLPEGSSVGIVFLTALDDVGSYQRALAAGGSDFLNKPINGDELIMRTRSLLWVSRLRTELDRGMHMLLQQRDSLISFQRHRDDLIGFLVHDLKNMLASVIGNAGFLARQLEDNEMLREAAEDILEVGNSMKTLVSDLIEVGQSEEGEMVIHRTPVDLSAALSHIQEQFNHRLRNSDEHAETEVQLQVEADLNAEVDEDLFIRMMENLLDNAVKYTPSGSTIEIVAHSQEDGVRLEVRDCGPGIAPEYREQVFKKYYRIKDGKNGNGVGLAFCRIVALEHDGAIWIEKNEPTGCCVCVQLPG